MKIKDGHILRNIADEWIIVPVGARIHDFNGLMTVNDTGAFLWKLLQEDQTEEELTKKLIEEYDADINIIKKDIYEFVNSLRQGGVLEE